MYRVAFEIAPSDHHHVLTTIFVAAGIFTLVVGAAFLFRIPTRGRNRQPKSVYYLLPLLLFLSIAGIVGFSAWNDESSKEHAALGRYQRNDYAIAEGTVENFRPMPKEGHKMESFSVSGVNFSYSEFIPNGGFNQTEVFGGPIHSGEAVRIGYVCYPTRQRCDERIIVRVDVRGGEQSK